MDKLFAILLATTTIISIYEVVSNDKAQLKNGEEDNDKTSEKDSFSQFDDAEIEEAPAYKYSEEAAANGGEEEEEELKIREPSRQRPTATFNRQTANIPHVKFEFCVSCGYKQAYEQFAQLLREKYPGIEVHGENYAPGLVRALSAQVLGMAKIGLIVCIIMGRDPFPALGLQTPNFFHWMTNNKMSASIMVFLFSNAIEGMLQSTGAFEIYLENERIWSKLESGRVPSPTELFEAIGSHMAIKEPNKFTSASFGIEDGAA